MKRDERKDRISNNERLMCRITFIIDCTGYVQCSLFSEPVRSMISQKGSVSRRICSHPFILDDANRAAIRRTHVEESPETGRVGFPTVDFSWGSQY